MDFAPSTPQPDEHASLLAAFNRLELAANAGTDWKPVREDLILWRDTLNAHFEKEEGSWLYAEASEQNPVLSATFRGLREEHTRMLRICDDMLGHAGVSRAFVCEGLETLGKLLRRHEREETDLVQHILYDDVGGSG